MHLDEEQIQRLRHGELASGLEDTVREHVAGCSECRILVARADVEEAEVFALLRQLDHRLPRVDGHLVAARARRSDFGRLRWAAGMLLVIGVAGAAIAAPRSSVRELVVAALNRLRAEPEARTVVLPAPSADAPLAGISVEPGAQLVILFTSTQAPGAARVSLSNGAEVTVRTATGAATFTSDAGRLVIDNSGSSSGFEIVIPRTAPRVEIRVNESRRFLKDGSRITTGNPADARGMYIVPLTQ